MKAKIINKKVLLNKKLIYCGDKNVQSIVFEVPSEIDGISLKGVPAYLKTENELAQKCKTRLPVEERDSELIMEWTLGAEATLVSGKLKCQIVFEHHSGEMVMNTEIFVLDIRASVSENGPKAVPEYNHVTQMQNELAGLYKNEVVKKGDPISLLNNDMDFVTRGEIGNVGTSGGTVVSSGISKIEKTATNGLIDTYTIYLTNGTQQSFTVTNGKGIKNVYCSNSNSATLIDTYTIVYTDESTSTFQVKNGANGDDGVGIDSCECGNYYEEDGYTVTPLNVQLTNGEKKSMPIKAKNSSGILDYTLLPSTSNNNLDEKAIYRVPRAIFYSCDKGRISSSEMCCNIMNELPSVGNPAAVFDSSFNITHVETYYIPATNSFCGYVDANLAAVGGGLPVGWYPAENLFNLINIDFGGIVYSIDHAVSGKIYLLIEHDLYTLKNGRFELINVSEDKKYQWNNSQTFKKEVSFEKEVAFENEVSFGSQSQVSFEGAVDFSSAEVRGLSSGGSSVLTKRKVTLAELQSLITTENMGMFVSIICKNSSKRDYNGVVAPMLKIGYSTLSTNAPEIFNRYIYSISDSSYNGEPVIKFSEFLLRITKSGVIFNNYIYRINKTTLEFTSSTEALKTDLTDSNFDFYVFI